MAFWVACFVVLVGGAVASVAVWAVARRLSAPLLPFDVPERWGDDPDDKRWESEATDAVHGALKAVQGTATAWAATITTLLGVGGTVAAVKGPDAFSKLTPATGNLVFWLSVLTALLASAAILFAALAAQGTPRRVQGLDGATLKKLTADGAARASRLLRFSRAGALVAASALLLAVGIAWHAGIASSEPSSSSALVETSDGAVRCGQLHASSDGTIALSVGSTQYSLQAGSPITSVDSCPAAQ